MSVETPKAEAGEARPTLERAPELPSTALARITRNGGALFALGGAFIAAALPAAEFVKGLYELKAQRQEHADQVELEFLKLLTAEKTAPPDRRRILQVIIDVSAPSPLQEWARDQAAAYDSEIEQRRKLYERLEEANQEANEQKRAWLLASNDVEAKGNEIQESYQSHDGFAKTQALMAELEVLKTAQKSKYDAWNASEDAAAAARVKFTTQAAATPSLVSAATVAAVAHGTAAASGSSETQAAPGVVAAPVAATSERSALSQITPRFLRALFPSASPENLDHNGPVITRALAEAGLTDRDMLLVAFATLAVEDPRLSSTVEQPMRFNTSPGGLPFDLYENRRDLGNAQPGDGERYRGRGFLWLTGRSNYEAAAQALSLPSLLDQPDTMAEPEIAARAYAWYLKSRAARLRQAARDDDLQLMRRLVSGGAGGTDELRRAWRAGTELIDAGS